MIKLTSHTGEEPIFINPGEIAFVWEGDAKEHDARANAILRLRPFSWEARGVLVKETPAEVAALIEEALGAAGAGSERWNCLIVRGDEAPTLDLMRLFPDTCILAADKLSAHGIVQCGDSGPQKVVRFTLLVAGETSTAVFDGWDKAEDI